MKLLELTRLYYPSIGGMERFIYDRTKIYERLGIQYNIISTTLQTEKKDTTVPLKNVNYLRQLTPYNLVPTLPFYLSGEYDIISVNSIGRFYSDYAIYHYAGKRQILILTPYFAFHSDKYSLLKKLLEGYLFPKLVKKVDSIIVFSQIEKNHWINTCNVKPEKIFVIPPYLVVGEKLVNNHSTDKKFLLYLGRREVNKKTDLLVQAFLELPQVNLELKLTLNLNDVSKSLRTKVLNDKRIQLLGVVNEKKKNDLLSTCEALVFPTSWESFGYVAFEASKYKKPLLCSTIPVLKELHNSDGVLFFNNTIESMTDTIKIFSTISDERKKKMGELNYENLKKFTFESACEQYKNMFDSLFDSKK